MRAAGATASCGKREAANNADARPCKGQSVAKAVSGSRMDGECLRQSELAKAERLCEGGSCYDSLDLPLVVLSPSRFSARGTEVLKKRVPGAHERRLQRLNVPANAYSTVRRRLRHCLGTGGTAAANGVACAGLCTESGTPAFRVACIALEGVGRGGGREDIVAFPARAAEAAAGEWIAPAQVQAEVACEPSNPGYWQWKATCTAAATIVLCTTSAKISVGALLVDLALALFTPTAAVALAALAVWMAYASAAVARRREDVTAAAAASAGAAQLVRISCTECNSSNRRCRIQGFWDSALRLALSVRRLAASLWCLPVSGHCNKIPKRCTTRQRRRFSVAQQLLGWCFYCCTCIGENSVRRATAIAPPQEGIPSPSPPTRGHPSRRAQAVYEPPGGLPGNAYRVFGVQGPSAPQGAAVPNAGPGVSQARLQFLLARREFTRLRSRFSRGRRHGVSTGGRGRLPFFQRRSRSGRSGGVQLAPRLYMNFQAWLSSTQHGAPPWREDEPPAPTPAASHPLLVRLMYRGRRALEDLNNDRENQGGGNDDDPNPNEGQLVDRVGGPSRRLAAETNGMRSAAGSLFLEGTVKTAYEGLSHAREERDVWSCNKVKDSSKLIHKRNAAAVGAKPKTEAVSRDPVAADVTVQEDSAPRSGAGTDAPPFQTGDFKKRLCTSELEEPPSRGATSSDLPQLLPHAASSAAPAAVSRPAAGMNASANAAESVHTAASLSRQSGGAPADFRSIVERLSQRKGETEAEDSEGQAGVPAAPAALLQCLLHGALQVVRASDVLWWCTDTPRPTDALRVSESGHAQAAFASVPASGLPPHAHAPPRSLHPPRSAAYAHHSDGAEDETSARLNQTRGATRSGDTRCSAAALAVVPCNDASSRGNGFDREGGASAPRQWANKHSIESYCECRPFVCLASSFLSLWCMVVFLCHAVNVGFIRWLQRRWTRGAPRPVHRRCIFNDTTGRDSPAGAAFPSDRPFAPCSLTEKPFKSRKRYARFLSDLVKIFWLIHVVTLVGIRFSACTVPQKHREMHPDLVSPVAARGSPDLGSAPFSRALPRAQPTGGLRAAWTTCESRVILCVCGSIFKVHPVLLFYSGMRIAFSRYPIKVYDPRRVVVDSAALHHSLMRAVESGQDAATASTLPSDSGSFSAALGYTLQGPFLSQPSLLNPAAYNAVIHQPSGKGEIGKVTYLYIFQICVNNHRSRWAVVRVNALGGITAAACPGQRIGLPAGAMSVRRIRRRVHRPGHAAPAVKDAVAPAEAGEGERRASAAAALVALCQLMCLSRDTGGAKVSCPAVALSACSDLNVRTLSRALILRVQYATAHVLGATEMNASPGYCRDLQQLLFGCCGRGFRAAAVRCGGSLVPATDNLVHAAACAFLSRLHTATHAAGLALFPSVEPASKRSTRAVTSYSASASTSDAAVAVYAAAAAPAVQRTNGDLSIACVCDVLDASQAYLELFPFTSAFSLLSCTCVCMLSSRAAPSSGSARTLFLDLLFLRPLVRLSARDYFSDVKNSSRSMRPRERVSSQTTRRKEISLDVVFRLCCLKSPASGRSAVTVKAVSKADTGNVAPRGVPRFVFRTCVMHARVAPWRRGSGVSEPAKLLAPSPCCRKPTPPNGAVFEGAQPSDATQMKSSPRPRGKNRSTGRVATATTACAAGMSTSDHWCRRPDGFVDVEDGNEGTGGRDTGASAHCRLQAACAAAAAAVGFAAASPTVAHFVCTGLFGSVWLLTVGLLCTATVLAAGLAVSAIVVFFAAAGGARGAGLLLRRQRLCAAVFGATPSLSPAPSTELCRRSRSASRNQMIPSIRSSLPWSPASPACRDIRTAPATDTLCPRSLHRHKASARLLLLMAYCTCCCGSFTGGTAFHAGLVGDPETSLDRSPLPTGASSSSLSGASRQPVRSLSYSVGGASSANAFASTGSGSVAALAASSSRRAATYGNGFDSSSPHHSPVTTAIAMLGAHFSTEPSEVSQRVFAAPEASADLWPGGTGEISMLQGRLRTLPPSSAPVPRPIPSAFTEAASPDAARPPCGTLDVQGGNPACVNVRASLCPGATARRQLSAGQRSALDSVAAGLPQRQETASRGTGEAGASSISGGRTGGDVLSAASPKEEAAAGRKEESREGQPVNKAEASVSTSAVVTDGDKAARSRVANSRGSTATGVDDRTQSEAAPQGIDFLNVFTKSVKQQHGSGSSPENQLHGGSGQGAVQHVPKNAEAGPAATTTVAAAAAGAGDQHLEASSRDGTGARQPQRGNESEAGGAALSALASTVSVTASPVNAEASTSTPTVGQPGGASGGVSDAAEASQQSSATPEGSRTLGKALQPSSTSTQLFGAASETLPTAGVVPTIGTATLSTAERSTGAPLASVASTAAPPAAPTINASSAAVPPSPAAGTQPAGDVLAGAVEIPAASVAHQLQTAGERPAGSVEAGKEERHVYVQTPQAAVVVPAVLQQEVDADQQLVRVTIPLLPSMRLPTQPQAGDNGSNGKGTRGAPLGDDSRQSEKHSIVSLGKEGGSTSSTDEQRGEDRKNEQERDSAKRENPESSRRPFHRDNVSAADGGAHSSAGGAGETLEEMSSNEKEIVISTGLLTLLVVLAVSLVLAHVSRKCRLDWLQMPVCATVLGLVVGAALKFGLQVKGPLLDTILAMNEDVFFVMLLPPIIFEGGLGLSEGSFSVPFMRNFGAIMWLACFCTIISFCWVGCLMFFGGQLRLSLALTVRQAFAFGALISSTDPVSVLALFKDLHAKRLIHVLVFGESLLNDAISIVLYRTVASEENTSVGAAILAFFLTFFVSLLVGLAVGLFCALTYKYMDLHKEENQILESALLLLIPWIAYLVADGAGYSGIVAICFCGVAVGKYAFPNLSAAAQATSRSVFTCFSLLAETVVFVFLGLAVFSFNQELYTFPFGLYALGFVATFTARGVSIYVTCLIINFFRSSSKITGQQQLALALCGLRGAIAFALSERASHDFGGREGAALLSLTLWLALFTILVLGPSLVVILDHLGVFESRGCSSRNAAAKARRQQHLKSCCSDSHVEELRPQRLDTGDCIAADEISLCNPDGSTAGGDSNTGDSSSRGEDRDEDDEDSLEALTRGTCGSLKRMLLHIDERYMIPMFTHSDNRHRQRLPAPQVLQQHGEDGGMLLPEGVPDMVTAGSRRRNRFSSAAVGRLARFTRDVQIRDCSLPVVASVAAGARPPTAAFTESGRRTISQQSDSSSRFSSRSAVSAPPGRPTQQPTDFKGSGRLSNKSSNSLFSNSSSSSTDMERGSAVLLLPAHAHSTSTSGSSRARSRRRVASFGRRASSRRPVLVRGRFAPVPGVTTTKEEKTRRAGWPQQQSSEHGNCEMPVDSAACSDLSSARQQDGPRSGVLSWTSYQLRRIALGILAATTAARIDSYSATRTRPTATAPSNISSKERGAPAAEQSPVTGNLFRRGGTGIRPSSRDLQLLLSGASTTSSSGGTHTKELSSSGRTRRRTGCGYTANLRKHRQSQYQPLREQLDQSQQPIESSRICVEPHVLGVSQYDAEMKQPLSPDEDGGTRETTAATRAPAAAPPVLAGHGPAAEMLQSTAGAAASDLLEEGRKRLPPETRGSKLSVYEDCRGRENDEEKEVKAEEAEGDINHATGGPAVEGAKVSEKQTTSSDDWSSLSRSEEHEGDHCHTIHGARIAEPQSLLLHDTPLVLQQQRQQQP